MLDIFNANLKIIFLNGLKIAPRINSLIISLLYKASPGGYKRLPVNNITKP